MISYNEFIKLDIRVGLIKVCEFIPKSKRLYRLLVDCGESNLRQIITGISKFYSSEELVDKKIVVLTNLFYPRKRSITSKRRDTRRRKNFKLALK
ncbi:MAG: tRNA-binding protein [Promethearchaeota archaeon]